jgi:hypothetical protein
MRSSGPRRGWAGSQPVYSDSFRQLAPKRAGIRLGGGLKQYVIPFDIMPNAKAAGWIEKALVGN